MSISFFLSMFPACDAGEFDTFTSYVHPIECYGSYPYFDTPDGRTQKSGKNRFIGFLPPKSYLQKLCDVSCGTTDYDTHQKHKLFLRLSPKS